MSKGGIECPVCKAEMKLLLTSFYCPNDCDLKPSRSVQNFGDDEITLPFASNIARCKHEVEYEGTHGGVSGLFCWQCGKLLQRF